MITSKKIEHIKQNHSFEMVVFKILNYIRSYFKPILNYEDNLIILRIRGIKVVAQSEEELCCRMNVIINNFRKQLLEDFNTATKMSVRGNMQWNIGNVAMNNTRKNLEAFEGYYYRYCE